MRGIMERWNIVESQFHHSIIPPFHVYDQRLSVSNFNTPERLPHFLRSNNAGKCNN